MLEILWRRETMIVSGSPSNTHGISSHQVIQSRGFHADHATTTTTMPARSAPKGIADRATGTVCWIRRTCAHCSRLYARPTNHASCPRVRILDTFSR